MIDPGSSHILLPAARLEELAEQLRKYGLRCRVEKPAKEIRCSVQLGLSYYKDKKQFIQDTFPDI